MKFNQVSSKVNDVKQGTKHNSDSTHTEQDTYIVEHVPIKHRRYCNHFTYSIYEAQFYKQVTLNFLFCAWILRSCVC